MDEEVVNPEEEKEKPFSNAEIALVGMGLLLADLVDLLSFGIPIGDIIAFPFLQIYLRVKGLKGIYGWLGNGAELIPGIDYLPLRTASFLVSAYIANNRPELIMLGDIKKGPASGKAIKGEIAHSVEDRVSEVAEQRFERSTSLPAAAPGRSDRTIDLTEGTPSPSGRVITEEDFGMPKENPLEQTKEDLFSENRGFSKTWNRKNYSTGNAPSYEEEDNSEKDELEERLDTGLSRLKDIANNKDVLSSMEDIPQARSSKEGGETIDLRKEA